MYLLFQECTRSDYNGTARRSVSGDEYALVRCRSCRRKQAQFCRDADSAYGGGACFRCAFCDAFNDADSTYWVQGKIYEYSGFMCVNDAFDKTKYTRAVKKQRRAYKELAQELQALRERERERDAEKVSE